MAVVCAFIRVHVLKAHHSVSSPQILVPLCRLLLRAVYVETGVHCGRVHGGSVLWRSGGDHLHT